MRPIFSLYIGHFKNSKKIFIYSSIGLIIALTLISSSLYFIDNSQAELINKNFNKKSYAGNDIVINVDNDFSVGNNTKVQNDLSNSINDVINNYNFDFINKSSLYVTAGYSGFDINIPMVSWQNRQYDRKFSTYVFELTHYFKNELEQNHLLITNNSTITFPQSNPISINSKLEAYILYINSPSDYSDKVNPNEIVKIGNLTIFDNYGTKFNLSITDYSILQRTSRNYYYYYESYNLDDIQTIIRSPTSNFPYLNSLLRNTGRYVNSILFVSNLTQFANMINENSIQSQNTLINNIKTEYVVHLGFDYSKVDLSHINSFLEKQNYFYQAVIGSLSVQNFKHIDILFQTTNNFQSIQFQIQSMSLQFFALDIPILIVSLFLISFSFSLIYKNIVRNISIYKTRGASRWLMFWFQLIDLVFIICISVVIALLLGIPVSVLSLKSNYLLSFNNTSPPTFVFNYKSIIEVLFLWALFFMIVIDLNRIRKLSKISITEAEDATEKGEPYWKRHFLDIILLGYGLVFLIFIYLLNNNPNLFYNLSSVNSIITLLILPSPFAFIIGLILFISRFITVLLNQLSSVLWKKTGGLIAYSFKNIIRYRHTTIRAILLTTTVMAFIILFLVTPYSNIVNYKQNIYFQSGAEGNLFFIDNKIDISTIELIRIHYSKYIESLCPYITLSTDLSYGDRLNFLFVNVSSFVQSAYLNFDLGLYNNLNNDFKNLQISGSVDPLTPINILLDKGSLKQREADIGSNITLSYLNSFQRFRIIDSFSHWPYIQSVYQHGYSGNFYAIADINYFLNDLNGNISNSIFTNTGTAGLFIKFKPNVNLTRAVLDIETLGNVRFYYVPQLNIDSFRNGFSFLSSTGQVNLNILVSFLILAIIILFFIQFQINERKREIYTERAIGMKLNQLAFVFFFENMILIGLSLLIGFFVGIFLVDVINLILQDPYQGYPKHVSIIPFNIVFLVNGLVLIGTIIFSIIPSIYVTKQDISDSFASEY